ncbi:hypothetical protein FQN50_002096 [Emmonsiellopsis sp. PD_5]|nr:hypothetical protein FQN50_002096 [Emmonsiellopsis sp. PD_5]
MTQAGWGVPDGSQPDFTVTLRNGQSVPFSWKGWNSTWTDEYLGGKATNDLWVTSFDYTVAPFAELLAQGIDISSSGSFTWTIDVPDDSLSETVKYVVRFKNAADPPDSYTHSSPQLSSPGFIIVKDAKSTTTTSSSISSATSSSATNSINTPSTTSLPQDPDSSGLSTGAKAGIGVGAAVGGIAIIALVVFVFLRRRRGKEQAPEYHGMSAQHGAPKHQQSPPILEAPDSLAMAPAELPASQRV